MRIESWSLWCVFRGWFHGGVATQSWCGVGAYRWQREHSIPNEDDRLTADYLDTCGRVVVRLCLCGHDVARRDA